MLPQDKQDELTAPLAQAWQAQLQATSAEAFALLDGLAHDTPQTLANHFYAVLMDDSRANRFLDHEQVRNRLQPAMQRWLNQVLGARPGQIAELLKQQSVIGDVHARVGIPVDLVLRGMRVIKLALVDEAVRRTDDLQLAHQASITLLCSIGIACEGMTLAYSRSRERSARADAAYRLFSLIQNISAERERQRALLLDWENSLLYALAGPQGLGSVEPLSQAEFGLWFVHKGIPSFGQSSETEHTLTLIAQIDQLLAGQQGDAPLPLLDCLDQVRQCLGQIHHLQSMLFERIGKLDSGSDTLTNLLNRRFLPTVLRREIELATNTNSGFAVLLIDLDHFKQINDNHGHESGDRALQQVAATLSQYTRGSDYLFRYGGEEFVAVLVGVNEGQSRAIAENLRKLIANQPLQVGEQALTLTASIGIALFDGHPDYERLMARADAAMYQAKNNGRNQVAVSD
ncbi:MAG: diguanylate cyclase [Stenotrophomonas sp.]